jgi:hypothetical protein
MSEELKDFRYYADKAEWLLSGPEFDGRPIEHQRVLVEMARVFAELAKAAPKSTQKLAPVTPCNVGLHGYSNGGYDGTSRPCIFAIGHVGHHQTSNGVFFTGLDNADFPGQEDS